MTEPEDYIGVPLKGSVRNTSIPLVPASHANQALQIVGALIGALGGALLGAGLGPSVAGTTPIPAEGMQAIAKKCVEEVATCDRLGLASRGLGLPMVILGTAMILLQGFIMAWAYWPSDWWPRRPRKPTS